MTEQNWNKLKDIISNSLQRAIEEDEREQKLVLEYLIDQMNRIESE